MNPPDATHLEMEPAVLATADEYGTVEVVNIDDLQIDHLYQRDLNTDLVEKIAKDWAMAASGPIVVSRRKNGALYIVNGQHRAAGAKLAGEKKILAQVIDGLSPKREAELRLKGNVRRGDRSQERFRAQLAAGRKESLAIQAMCEQFDTRVNPFPDQRTGINAVSSVEWLWRKDGKGMHMNRVFEMIRDAFGTVGGPNASVAVLKGISFVLERHDAEMDRKRMVDRLGRVGVENLLARGHSYKASLGGAMWINFYRAALDAYNDRLPQASRLEWRTGGYTAPSSSGEKSSWGHLEGGGGGGASS